MCPNSDKRSAPADVLVEFFLKVDEAVISVRWQGSNSNCSGLRMCRRHCYMPTRQCVFYYMLHQFLPWRIFRSNSHSRRRTHAPTLVNSPVYLLCLGRDLIKAQKKTIIRAPAKQRTHLSWSNVTFRRTAPTTNGRTARVCPKTQHNMVGIKDQRVACVSRRTSGRHVF